MSVKFSDLIDTQRDLILELSVSIIEPEYLSTTLIGLELKTGILKLKLSNFELKLNIVGLKLGALKQGVVKVARGAGPMGRAGLPQLLEPW